MKGREAEKRQFKTGEEKDSELEQKLKEQKERVKNFFRSEEEQKKLDSLTEQINKLSDEEWKELAERRSRYHDSKP